MKGIYNSLRSYAVCNSVFICSETFILFSSLRTWKTRCETLWMKYTLVKQRILLIPLGENCSFLCITLTLSIWTFGHASFWTWVLSFVSCLLSVCFLWYTWNSSAVMVSLNLMVLFSAALHILVVSAWTSQSCSFLIWLKVTIDGNLHFLLVNVVTHHFISSSYLFLFFFIYFQKSNNSFFDLVYADSPCRIRNDDYVKAWIEQCSWKWLYLCSEYFGKYYTEVRYCCF